MGFSAARYADPASLLLRRELALPSSSNARAPSVELEEGEYYIYRRRSGRLETVSVRLGMWWPLPCTMPGSLNGMNQWDPNETHTQT